MRVGLATTKTIFSSVVARELAIDVIYFLIVAERFVDWAEDKQRAESNQNHA